MKHRTLNIFPFQQLNILTDSNIVIKTGVLNHTLDHDDNELITILGNPLRYKRYKQIINGLDKVNIVFVVDSGQENGKYMPNVMTLIQESKMFFDTSTLFNNYKYGVVMYKDNLGGSCADKEVLPPTKDYGSVIRFLQTAQQDIGKFNNDTITQPMFLQKCLDSLLWKIKLDDDNIATSLNHVFTTIGLRNTKIFNDYKFYYPLFDSGYLPISFVKTFSRKQQPFYVPA